MVLTLSTMPRKSMKEKNKKSFSEIEEEISERIYKKIKEEKVSDSELDEIISEEIENSMSFSEDWQKHYARERIKDKIKEKNLQSKPEKKKLKKEDIVGFIFGISLAWSIGLGGIVPYVIGTFFGIWLTGKMLNSEKQYLKVIFWILFVMVFLLGFLFRGMRLSSNYI